MVPGVGITANKAGPASCQHDRTRILGIMGKAPRVRVDFRLKRITQDDWQIEAHCPGVEIRYIKGFKTKAEVDEWLQGTRRIDWLRSQGYAK
jgi:hypothetical protein